MSDTPDTTTRHDYTDEEIKQARDRAMSEPSFKTGIAFLRAFLAALPPDQAERPQAQTGPWPGQQEAIDAAFCSSNRGSYTALKLSNPFDWEQQAPARLAIAQAYDKARPQSAEIAALKAALAESEKQFQDKVYEIARLLDECDKAQGILKACLSVMPFGNIKTHTFENLPGRIADLASEIASLSLENERLEAGIASLRQPIASVVLAQAVRRMEAVTVVEVADIIRKTWLDRGGWIDPAAEAIRARLIAAAKGEGQAVGVNEPPKDEKQPDLSGESEKQDPYARLKAYAKAGARIRTHDMEWARDANWTWCLRPESYEVHPDDLHMVPEYDPQAEPTQAQPKPAQPWTPDNAKAYEDFQAELRETWAAQPWTPAVGDVVRIKSGGPVMTVTSDNAGGHHTCTWFNSEDARITGWFPAACLTPAKEGQP